MAQVLLSALGVLAGCAVVWFLFRSVHSDGGAADNATQLKTDNERLRVLLIQSQTQLTQARNELTASQAQTKELQQQLTALKISTQNANNSLTTAQNELQKAKRSFKQSELEHSRTEERLRTQKTAWQLVSGSLFVALLF